MNHIEKQLKQDYVWHTRQLKARNNWLCRHERTKESKSEQFLKIEHSLIDLGIEPNYLTFVNELKALNT